jgi:hypothetical protein
MLVTALRNRFAVAMSTLLLIAHLFGSASARAGGGTEAQVDTALVLAVDVSDSVDAERYRLQMEGIARALEDPAVAGAITSGPRGGIIVSLLAWSDDADLVMPWQTIRSAEQARAVAGLIRNLPQRGGEYTCVAKMLNTVRAEVLTEAPARAGRIVVDVSGDGIDNCAVRQASDEARNALVGEGATINGLPIIVEGENDVVGVGTFRRPGFAFEDLGLDRDATTLDAWYRDHIIGGGGAFLHVADGYEDFGRAFRLKFITEVSISEQAVENGVPSNASP